MTPLKSLLASIESRFDEAIRPFSKDCDLFLVPNINASNKFWAIERKTEDIKAFIKQSHEEIIQAVVGEIRSRKIKRNDKGCYLKGDDGNTYIMNCEYGNCQHAGYNAALDDLKASLLPLVEK